MTATDTEFKLKYIIDYLKGVGLSFVLPVDELIDWKQAAALAFIVAEASKERIAEPWQLISDEFAELVKEVEPEIASFTELKLDKPLGYPLVFDRSEWIVTAVETIKPLVEPVYKSIIETITTSRDSLATPKRLVQSTTTIQIGTLLGYLAKKVLGQYDLPLASSEVATNGKLIFVYPNILAIENKFNLNRREFHLWLALHEATHSYEFEGNPWLHSYLMRLIKEHADFVEQKLKEAAGRADLSQASSNLIRLLFTSSFRDLMSLERNLALAKIQSFMAVVEGYSEYVMHELSQKIIPHSDEISQLFDRTRRSKTWAERLLERFMGLDIKLQQYLLGRDFVSAVARSGGIKLVNELWRGPENLPSLAEIRQPEFWLKRVGKS